MCIPALSLQYFLTCQINEDMYTPSTADVTSVLLLFFFLMRLNEVITLVNLQCDDLSEPTSAALPACSTKACITES